jgi:hypothetical protein
MTLQQRMNLETCSTVMEIRAGLLNHLIYSREGSLSVSRIRQLMFSFLACNGIEMASWDNNLNFTGWYEKPVMHLYWTLLCESQVKAFTTLISPFERVSRLACATQSVSKHNCSYWWYSSSRWRSNDHEWMSLSKHQKGKHTSFSLFTQTNTERC